MKTQTDTVAILSHDDATIRRELAQHGLAMSASEAKRLCGLLGRDPSRAEAFLFDVAWSEHCSYKSSRTTLRAFFDQTDAPSYVVLGPGEDAGIIRFAKWNDHHYCLVMSHESHNHPSQVLPVEGAATGVGGIVRDVICMGAEVIGVMDALRFGDVRKPACAEIARGIVEGIWRYGNALGVPNLGGDAFVDARFDDNCLVNVVALGIVREDRIIRSRVPREASRTPYVAVLVGKPTDASGFGGASFASADLLAEDAERNVGAVQLADPFLKRVLAEATRTALDRFAERGVAVGFKDLGAGGIGGATVELAAAGGLGVDIDLDAVRVSDPALPAEVVLVGETQERFVWAVPESEAEALIALYEREFELPRLYPGAGAVRLGAFTEDGAVTVLHRGRVVAACRAGDLTEGLVYERSAAARPAAPETARGEVCRDARELVRRFEAMLASPEGGSRGYIYRHYDAEVRAETVLRPGDADACVLLPIPGCPSAAAVGVAGNPSRGDRDAYQAGAWAVAGAVRNVATVGATPLALSDCLNFGNPEIPEVFGDFREAVRGIAETARALGVAGSTDKTLPVITGNVSFYNQSVGGVAIPPTPIVACVGRLDDVRDATDLAWKAAGNRLVWCGVVEPALGGTRYARSCSIEGPFPEVRVDMERALVTAALALSRQRHVASAHDVAEGGLLTTLFEMAVPGEEPTGFGARVDLTRVPGTHDPEAIAFGEGAAIVFEVPSEHVETVLETLKEAGVPAADIGHVTATPVLVVHGLGEGGPQDIDIRSLAERWQRGLASWLA